MNITHSTPRVRTHSSIRIVLATGLMLGVTLGAFAQAAPPGPTPFEAPVGPPPVTSSTANGQLGAAPVAPRSGDLTPPAPIDASAARAAAARGERPLPKSVEQQMQPRGADRQDRTDSNASPAISPAGAGNSPAGTPMR